MIERNLKTKCHLGNLSVCKISIQAHLKYPLEDLKKRLRQDYVSKLSNQTLEAKTSHFLKL